MLFNILRHLTVYCLLFFSFNVYSHGGAPSLDSFTAYDSTIASPTGVADSSTACSAITDPAAGTHSIYISKDPGNFGGSTVPEQNDILYSDSSGTIVLNPGFYGWIDPAVVNRSIEVDASGMITNIASCSGGGGAPSLDSFTAYDSTIASPTGVADSSTACSAITDPAAGTHLIYISKDPGNFGGSTVPEQNDILYSDSSGTIVLNPGFYGWIDPTVVNRSIEVDASGMITNIASCSGGGGAPSLDSFTAYDSTIASPTGVADSSTACSAITDPAAGTHLIYISKDPGNFGGSTVPEQNDILYSDSSGTIVLNPGFYGWIDPTVVNRSIEVDASGMITNIASCSGGGGAPSLDSFTAYDSTIASPTGVADSSTACSAITDPAAGTHLIYISKDPGNFGGSTVPEQNDILYSDSSGTIVLNPGFYGWIDPTVVNRSIEVDASGMITNIASCSGGGGAPSLDSFTAYDSTIASPTGVADSSTACSAITDPAAGTHLIYISKDPGNFGGSTVPEQNDILYSDSSGTIVLNPGFYGWIDPTVVNRSIEVDASGMITNIASCSGGGGAPSLDSFTAYDSTIASPTGVADSSTACSAITDPAAGTHSIYISKDPGNSGGSTVPELNDILYSDSSGTIDFKPRILRLDRSSYC